MKTSSPLLALFISAAFDTCNSFAFIQHGTGSSSFVSTLPRPAVGGAASSSKSALCMSVGIYFTTSTGNCETVSGYIAAAAGLEATEIGDASDTEITANEGLIVGAPTWNTGADQERSGTDWDEWLYNTLPNLNVSGKKVAIFGVGDQQSYQDNYCDAAGELYDLFTAAGAKVYGMTSTDGYEHLESKAEVDGKFVGLMCDEDNQDDLSEGRANDWVKQLQSEGFF